MQAPREVTYAEFEKLTNGLIAYYSPSKLVGVNSYEMTCPLCGDDNLHLQFSDRIQHIHCFSPECGLERKEELRARIKTDGFDINVVCTDPKIAGKLKGKKDDLIQNVPSHEQLPVDWWHHSYLDTYNKDGTTSESHKITHCYPYTTKEGWVVFYQLRANYINEKGEKDKLLKFYSSVKDTTTGKNTWAYRLLLKEGRPLYNLKELSDNPDKPVLLVEGEKACEAAKLLFPDYVCTTYAAGVKAWKQTSFLPLKGRNVTLWPDNKQDAIDTFLKLAEIIDPPPKITHTSELTDRDLDWDVADELPATALDNRSLLNEAETVETEKSVSPENELEIAEKYNRNLRVLVTSGSLHVYDKDIITPNDTWLPYSYLSFADLSRIYPEKIIGGKGKQLYAVDAWRDSPYKIISYGITFDPSTTEELIKDKHGQLYTNKFLGWEHEAKECNSERYMCFVEHIRHIMDKTSAEYFISFLAHIIQQPKNKPGVLPILIGLSATGKTIIGNIMQAMLGERNVLTTDGRTFLSKWSGQFSSKMLIFVNEFTTEGMALDFLNTLLTDKRVTLEHKNRALTSEPSYQRAIGTTNKAHFILSADDRRMFPIQIHNPSIDSHNKNNPNNLGYFRKLDDLCIDEEGLCGLLHYLKNYTISINVMTPPRTDYRALHLVQSNPVHAIIYDMCVEGALPIVFGKTVQNYISQEPGDGRTAAYPFRVYRHDMERVIKTLYPKLQATNTSITQEFMKFIAPKDKNDNIVQPFIRDGGTNVENAKKARYFELPPIEELRARYNKHVDPLAVWSELGGVSPDTASQSGKATHLRIVKDGDEGPI